MNNYLQNGKEKLMKNTNYKNLWSRKIMIISDDKNNQKRLCKTLEDEYEIYVAEHREEVFTLLEQYRGEIILILLDMREPIIEGYPLLYEIKHSPEYREIPVIVVIQNEDEELELKALKSGANEFIRLPYRTRIVKNRVNGIVMYHEKESMLSLMKYDRLTGIYNKEYFYQEAEEIFKQITDKIYDVISCNIESFSLINDMYGHHIGDELLCNLAKVLKDFVADHGICCRIHADNFLLLIEEGFEYKKELFQQLTDQLNQMFQICHVDLDFGIYHMKTQKISINLAADRAQLAIESIKGDYSRIFNIYDDRIRQERLFIKKIVRQMRPALSNKEFKVYYQPKYELKGKKVVGAEALVRWISPEDGFISPGAFIPIFEKNRFITELDKYVWEQVCIFKRRCRDNGIPDPTISVNVSYEDLFDPALPEYLRQLVEKYNIAPKDLHLEITESVYSENPDTIIERATRLREYGFVIEMDDFGKGYSSLNMLGELPLDVLKLDMRFMQNKSNGFNSNNIHILRFVLELAQWMKLRVIAEGVETKEQMEYLQKYRCDYAQGFYFARPMPEDDFVNLLKESDILIG